MLDREKVIKGLKVCGEAFNETGGAWCQFEDCPYLTDGCTNALCTDALALLKGQTAQWIWDRPHHFRCSGCNGVFGQMTYLYCPNCGREMSLEDTERRKEWED